jgi:hypothetical protein
MLDQSHQDLVTQLSRRADVARVAKEIAESLIALGRPATPNDIRRTVHAHAPLIKEVLDTLVAERVVERVADVQHGKSLPAARYRIASTLQLQPPA